MNARSAGCRLLLATFAVAAIAACSDSTGPPPVSSVDVTGAVPLKVGDSVQLAATVRDADGNVLTDREVTWSSSDDGIGAVSLTGMVTANATGMATIRAASEGTQGTADITVSGEVALASVSPAVLRAGEAATLSGDGFSTTLSANLVLVGGERATVTEATPTELRIVISSTACQVTGDVDVQVRVDPEEGEEASNVLRHPFEAEGTALSLDVGELSLIESTPDFCLRFGATSEGEAYLIGLQSTGTTVATLTPATVSAATPGSAAALVPGERPDVAGAAAAPGAGSRLPTALAGLSVAAFAGPAGREARWHRHRQAELSLRRQDARLLEAARPVVRSHTRPGLANAVARSAAASRSITANVQVGDTVPIRVPELDSVCAGFDSIATVVRHVGERAVWLEDVDNPSGGFTANDFEQLNQTFDDRIHPTNVEYFGEPLDLDENGRIGVVTTKEVNARENVLGFVSGADLVPREDCASSDFGELYYGRTPDPTGEFGDEYPLAEARLDAPQLIAHEFSHIIQFSGWLRLEVAPPGGLTTWNLEGQALIAEELNGHAATGRSTGQNYGFDVAWTGVPGQEEEQTEIAWYASGFIDLFLYYGFRDRDASVPGAPEECSWLGLERDGNDGPCQAGREVYGVPWSIFRWLADHFSVDVGGEPAFQRALVEHGSSGFHGIAQLVPVPRNRWLAEWAAALYLDDRVNGQAARLTFTSWDLADIESGVVPTAHLRPRQRAFTSFSDGVRVRAGSTAYFCVGRAQQGDTVDCANAGTGRPETVVRARDALGGNLPSHMQLWVVRLE
ncbi:MAG: Ig-like domain-containing protein [Longimicrobiales bacterium]